MAFPLLRGGLSPSFPVPSRVSFLRPYSRRCPINNGDGKANSHQGAACSLCPHQSGPSQYPPRAPAPGSSRPDKVSRAHLLARRRMAAEEPTLEEDRPGGALGLEGWHLREVGRNRGEGGPGRCLWVTCNSDRSRGGAGIICAFARSKIPPPSFQFILPSEGKEETSASGPKVGWKE